MINPQANPANDYRWPEDASPGQPPEARPVAQEDFSKSTAMTVGGPVAETPEEGICLGLPVVENTQPH